MSGPRPFDAAGTWATDAWQCTVFFTLCMEPVSQMTRMLGMGGGGEGMEDLPDQLLGKVEGMLEVVRKVRGLAWVQGVWGKRMGVLGHLVRAVDRRGQSNCTGNGRPVKGGAGVAREVPACLRGCARLGATGMWANARRGRMFPARGCGY